MGVGNVVANHLSRLTFEEKREVMPIKDDFPNEQLPTTLILQWFAHMLNYLVLGKVPQVWETQDRRRLFLEVRNFYWDDLYFFTYYPD